MSSDSTVAAPWYRSTLAIALVGSVLLWAALPPLSIGWLGWIAPVPWLFLVRSSQLPGRRPYRSLYLAGLAFWLAAVHWLRLPHPLVYAGWFALSAYLAAYLPVFVGLSRVGVHRLGLPLWLAAPTVWTGLELARAHVMTGFLMGSLAHTQVHATTLIQFSDLVGEYGVDFLVMLVSACVAQKLLCVVPKWFLKLGISTGDSATEIRNSKAAAIAMMPAVIALAAVLGYGRWRQSDVDVPAGAKTVRIALIQGNSLADWKLDQAKQRQIMDEYVRLSQQAVAQALTTTGGEPLDLIVWPETMFRVPLFSFDADYQLPADASRSKEELAAMAPQQLSQLVAALGVPILVGIDRLGYENTEYSVRSTENGASQDSSQNFQPTRAYNSAVLVGRDGKIVGTYDKFHLVMFGEYVPFSRWLPFLNKITSLTGSVDAGDGPVALTLDGTTYAPNICYETVIPHVIRQQVSERDENGRTPQILVNMTNDAWYWGSSELEQHLACGVFRAIETRLPLVIAANGGVSAWIDNYGRIRAQGPKMKSDVIIADVQTNDGVETFYVKTGDWFAAICLIACLALAVTGWQSSRRNRPSFVISH